VSKIGNYLEFDRSLEESCLEMLANGCGTRKQFIPCPWLLISNKLYTSVRDSYIQYNWFDCIVFLVKLHYCIGLTQNLAAFVFMCFKCIVKY